MNPSSLDASPCPRCGGPNSCALEMGKRIEDCWCFTTRISADLLERTPDEQRGKTCICPNCATPETSLSIHLELQEPREQRS